MNTINNPLILKWREEQYKVNKPEDQSGEYVDKALAEEMLEILEALYDANRNGEGQKDNWIKAYKIILKAKGE
jgi:hypothetical protein